MNVPNLITLIRILLTPVTVWLLISADYRLALLVFVLAGLSDAADGWLARVTASQSELGSYLDPLADKLLLVSCMVTLAVTGAIPLWLVMMVISRDVLIVGGVLMARFLDKPFEVRPLMISKANTFVQIGYVVLVLARLAFGVPPAELLFVAIWLTAGFTLASGLAYIRAWVRHMSGVEA